MLDEDFTGRVTRQQSKQGEHVINYALMSSSTVEPSNFKKACANEDWAKAMGDEMEQIEKKDSWELVSPPKGKTIVGMKWIYKLKYDVGGSIARHKARLVAKGYVQQEGIDYEDTFAPVARLETVRSLLALASHFGLAFDKMDVKSAF